MKLTLFLVLLAVSALASVSWVKVASETVTYISFIQQAAPPPEVCSVQFLEKVYETCLNECAKTDEIKARLRNWQFELTDDDRCFVKCGWKRLGKLKPDGSVDVPGVVSQFERFGVEVPAETQDLADTAGNIDLLVQKTAAWAPKNKDAIIKACS